MKKVEGDNDSKSILLIFHTETVAKGFNRIKNRFGKVTFERITWMAAIQNSHFICRGHGNEDIHIKANERREDWWRRY